MAQNPDDFVAQNAKVVTVLPAHRRVVYPWADLAAFISQPEPPAIIQSYLPAGSFVVLYGGPKTFKSFVAFSMTLSIAVGLEWLGHQTACGHCFYLCGEGASGVRKRLRAWLEHNAAKLDDLSGRWHLLPVRLALNEPGVAEQVVTDIRAQMPEGERPVTIVVDTLSRYTTAGQDKPEEMGLFVDAVDKIAKAFDGCSVIVVHHEGKTQGKGPRGSNALLASADVVMLTERPSLDRSNFKLTVEHMKDWDCPAPMQLLLRRVDLGENTNGDPISSGVVVLDDAAAPPDQPNTTSTPPLRLSNSARIAFDALTDLLAREGATPSPDRNIPPGKLCVEVARWRDHALSRGLSDAEAPDSQNRAFRRAADSLIAKGCVGIWKKYSWVAS